MVSSVIHPQSYRVIKGKLFNNFYLCPVHKKWADYTNLYIIDNSAYTKRIPYFPPDTQILGWLLVQHMLENKEDSKQKK